MESIYDVQVYHTNDTKSIGANSILSDDWSAWSDWMSETESIGAKSDLSNWSTWSDWTCETESIDTTWKEKIKTYCTQERQKQHTMRKIVKQRTTIERVKDNSDANTSSYVQWKGEIIKSNSENSLDDTTDTYSTDTTRDSCRSDVEQDTQEQQKVTTHVNKGRYVLSKIFGETAIENEVTSRTGDRMTMALSLFLRSSLEDPDNHKEKPLTCNLEPDIYSNKQKVPIGINLKIIKKLIDIQESVENPLAHLMEPLSCDLEPNILV